MDGLVEYVCDKLGLCAGHRHMRNKSLVPQLTISYQKKLTEEAITDKNSQTTVLNLVKRSEKEPCRVNATKLHQVFSFQ